MRRSLSLLLALTALALCGCGGLNTEAYEVEQLRVMQIIGLDRAPAGLSLSLAAAPDPEPTGEALCFTAQGPGIAEALARVREQSAEEELFCGHVKQLLVGESLARQGLEPSLSYVARSADLRLDMPLFILKGGRAEELMAVDQQGRGVTALIDAAQTRLERRQGGPAFTVRDLYRSLIRCGSGAVWALEVQQAAEAGGDQSRQAAVPAGLVLFREGQLTDFADMDQALGFCLLMGRVGTWEVSVRDRFGRAAVLEIQKGETQLEPGFDDSGALSALTVSAQVRASVAECPVGADPQAAAYAQELTALLEGEVSRRIGDALALMRRERLDPVGLGARLERLAPGKLPQGFPLPAELALSVSVQGRLENSSDVGEAGL